MTRRASSGLLAAFLTFAAAAGCAKEKPKAEPTGTVVLGGSCAADSDCASGLCLGLELAPAVGACTRRCDAAAPCPAPEFECVVMPTSDTELARVCIAADLCLDRDLDGYGVGPGCLGYDCDEDRTDVHEGAAELCDGFDNDCDGVVDDTPDDVGQPCVTGSAGICAAGRVVCDLVAGAPVCQADRAARAESCNGLDDDCNGSVDDGNPEGGVTCFTGLIGHCGQGETRCSAGGIVCDALFGPTAELCDGIDNDCNGAIDDGIAGLGSACFSGQGICRQAGVFVCAANPASPAICDAVPSSPLPVELCNYLDDDCDGQVDEGFLLAGKYVANTACGSCFTDCTAIYAKPNAQGVCDATGTPICTMSCSPGFFDLNQVPDDGCEFAQDGGAIYVSNAGIDVPTCGLGPAGTVPFANEPCATIAYGLARASAASRTRVLVADGEYPESVTLVNGVSLLGGYRADTWERHLATTGTTLRAPWGAGHRKAVIAAGINAPTVFEGFVVYGAHATQVGSNSYGVYVLDSGGSLEIRNNRIFAGAGAPGGSGSNGISGQTGVNAGNGSATYNLTCAVGTSYSAGAGAAGVRACQDPATLPAGGGDDTFTPTSGGSGGAPVCATVNIQSGSGANGLPGGGAGGAGGWGHLSTAGCTPTAGQLETGVTGGNGAAPTDGTGGTGCSSAQGTVIGGEWIGTSGTQGTHGTHGRGGGGGGSGGGQRTSTTASDIPGGGGGGGSGGCAGQRGVPGAAAGGSFGLFVTWTGAGPAVATAIPQVYGNVISRGFGGGGGDGGNGGAGGDGGGGGLGGGLATYTGPIYCIFGGANGGFGSRGGHGGGGGGGCGGASYDVGLFNMNAVPYTARVHDNQFPMAAEVTGGAGGAGGNSSATSSGLGGVGAAGAYGTIVAEP